MTRQVAEIFWNILLIITEATSAKLVPLKLQSKFIYRRKKIAGRNDGTPVSKISQMNTYTTIVHVCSILI